MQHNQKPTQDSKISLVPRSVMDDKVIRKRCRDIGTRWVDNDRAGYLREATYRAAYVDGLKYAAIIARERGKPHDIDWWHNSSKREISRQTAIDLAELIEQHAKEMGHE